MSEDLEFLNGLGWNTCRARWTSQCIYAWDEWWRGRSFCDNRLTIGSCSQHRSGPDYVALHAVTRTCVTSWINSVDVSSSTACGSKSWREKEKPSYGQIKNKSYETYQYHDNTIEFIQKLRGWSSVLFINQWDSSILKHFENQWFWLADLHCSEKILYGYQNFDPEWTVRFIFFQYNVEASFNEEINWFNTSVLSIFHSSWLALIYSECYQYKSESQILTQAWDNPS